MKKVIYNFLYNSLYQILIMIIPLVTAPYLARVIGAEGVGKYSYTYSIAYYFQIFIKLGLDSYGSRTISSHKQNNEDLKTTFWSIYFMQFMCGIIFVALFIIYTIFIASDFTAAWILLLFVISGMFDVNWFFNGLEKFKLTVVRSSIVKIAATICIFVFVKSNKDVYSYIAIMALSFLVSQLIIWPFVFKEISYKKVSFQDVLPHLKPNAILFIAILAVSLYRYMGKIMLGSMINESEVGYYENADKIMQIPISFVNALGVVMLPRMSSIYSSGANREKSDKVMLSSIIFAMALSSLICLGIIGVSTPFVHVFFGPGFEKCIGLLQILMPSCLFMSFANVIRTQYLIPQMKDSVYVSAIVLGAIINIIVNSLLIPLHGAYGAALGTLSAEVTVCISQVFMIRKFLKIKQYLLYSMPFIVAGLGMLFIIKAFENGMTPSFSTLVKGVEIGIISYAIILIVILLPQRKHYLALIRRTE